MFFQLPTLTCLGSTRCISFSYYPSLSLSLSFTLLFWFPYRKPALAALAFLKASFLWRGILLCWPLRYLADCHFLSTGSSIHLGSWTALIFIVLCNPLSSIHPIPSLSPAWCMLYGFGHDYDVWEILLIANNIFSNSLIA